VSTNGGRTWSAENDGLKELTVEALALNPRHPQLLFIGTSRTIFKSRNGGENWSEAHTGLLHSAGELVAGLTVDPANPDTLYMAGDGSGTFKSTNGGRTWFEINNSLGSYRGRGVAIDPADPNTMYAAEGFGGGVFKSTDGGRRWFATGLLGVYANSVVVDPQHPDTVYAAIRGTSLFCRSNDGGRTWSVALTIAAGAETVVLDPSNPSTLYAIGGGVFKSTDDGQTWSEADQGLNGQQNFGLAVDPAHSNTLYVNGDNGVYKSTDGGAHWLPTSLTGTVGASPGFENLAIDPSAPNTLYAAVTDNVTNFGSIYKSTDGGATWAVLKALADQDVGLVVLNPRHPDTVYVGSSQHSLFVSYDGGQTWSGGQDLLDSRLQKARRPINQTPPFSVRTPEYGGQCASAPPATAPPSPGRGLFRAGHPGHRGVRRAPRPAR
jgi:photosystem II stability/assembly factor-like uncharacterized protein